MFTTVAPSSFAWKDHYDAAAQWSGSTAAWPARSTSTIHSSAGWRGMRLSCTLALSITLTMALGRIEAGQRENMHSLTNSA